MSEQLRNDTGESPTPDDEWLQEQQREGLEWLNRNEESLKKWRAKVEASDPNDPKTHRSEELTFDQKPGPTENPIATFNLGVELKPRKDADTHFNPDPGTDPDFNLTHTHTTAEARKRIAELPEADRIMPAEDLVPTPKQELELRSPETLVVNGQEIEVLKVNWPSRREREPIPEEVTVFFPAFLADPTDGPAHEVISQIALQMPDRPALAIGTPKLTNEQRQALDDNGDITPLVETFLTLMKSEGITDINLLGRSMGTWIASAVAAHAHEAGVEVHRALVLEPPLVNLKQLAKGFIQEIAKKYPDFYHEHPDDPRMKRAARLDRSPIRKLLYDASTLVKPILRGQGWDFARRLPKGMASGTIEGDLDTAASHQPNFRPTLVNGGKDPISPNSANDAIADRLNHKHGKDFVDRVIGPGEPHSHLESAKATAALLRRNLAPTRSEAEAA